MVTHDHQVEDYVERVVLIRDGRTSTETRYAGTPGERTAEELVIVDAAGRLQLPAVYVEALGLRGRARVRMEAGRIIVAPASEGRGAGP